MITAELPNKQWCRGSTDYLPFVVTANYDLVDQVVEISFDREAWIEANWVGDPGKVRTAQSLISDEVLPARSAAFVFMRVVDNPSEPVELVGLLEFI